jgi:hypothetical protein
MKEGLPRASNMGNVFERLLSNRIKNDITITEAQTGGQAGRSTADHINSIINQQDKTRLIHSIPRRDQGI